MEIQAQVFQWSQGHNSSQGSKAVHYMTSGNMIVMHKLLE